MIILALDTCFNACSAAIGVRGSDLQWEVTGDREAMRQGHAEALLPMVERVVVRAGLALSDIDRIAVTHGPGTFTGVRTGLAAARALALACNVPAIGVSSLWAIGAAAGGNVLVAADAGRGRLFIQAIGTEGTALTAPALATLDEAAALALARGLPVTGSGAAVLAAAGFEIRALAGDPDPDARTLIAFAAPCEPPAHPPRPLYLREPDAKPQVGAAIARQP